MAEEAKGSRVRYDRMREMEIATQEIWAANPAEYT